MQSTVNRAIVNTEDKNIHLHVAIIFVISRLGLLLVGKLAEIYFLPPSQMGLHSGLDRYFCHFDCHWFLGIAEHGYSGVESPVQPGATNFGFFPLFPMAVRFVAFALGNNYLIAAVLVSNLCFYFALLYIYRYARLLDVSRNGSMLAVLMVCILPQSIVFSSAYSESLFLLLMVLATYHQRIGNYWIAGIAAAFLSATRTNGIFFILFSLVFLVRQYGISVMLTPWREPKVFVPIMLCPLGLFLFWGYSYFSVGDAFAHPTTEQHGWQWFFVPPWQNLVAMIDAGGMTAVEIWTSFAVVLCTLLLLRQRLFAEFALCAGLILLVWSAQGAGSMFRYWLVLFPTWIAVANFVSARMLLACMLFSILSLVSGIAMCAWILQNPLAI